MHSSNNRMFWLHLLIEMNIGSKFTEYLQFWHEK